mmetsp:Transcript_39058/g.70498  ORF Transcript_39058/g.70498 Transcript_39058/m.70498 type:complete len:233 (-) Transcript_39058:1678-2376(-)
MFPVTIANARIDISAIFDTCSSSMPAVRQIIKKVSPSFLFTAPRHSSTTPWTISAIWLTNVITLPCRTSVAVVKFRIRAMPTMQSTREPSTIAFTPCEDPCMLELTIFAPASPNPKAKSDPSLMMVFSNITVSMGSLASVLHSVRGSLHFCSACFRFSFFAISSFLNSSSAIFIATNGLSRMASTFLIIFSTGCSTKTLAVLVKKMAAMQRITQMKIVVKMLIAASDLANGR